MANLQKYTGITAYINGALLSEEVSCSVKRMSNAQKVITVPKGFAGLSPGAAEIQVEVDSAVPSADFELNPQRFLSNLDTCELTLFAAGRTLTVTGFITDDNFSHAANTESKLQFTFVGGYAEWV